VKPLALVAALRFAQYLGRRIDKKLARHVEICAKARSCKVRKHKRQLNAYVYLMAVSGLLEDEAMEAIDATSTGCR